VEYRFSTAPMAGSCQARQIVVAVLEEGATVGPEGTARTRLGEREREIEREI